MPLDNEFDGMSVRTPGRVCGGSAQGYECESDAKSKSKGQLPLCY